MTLRDLGASFGSLASAGLLLLVLGAPVQCPVHREPSRERTTPPADAVYEAAEHLQGLGDEAAHRATLRYIVERYPGTQAAARARDELSVEPE